MKASFFGGAAGSQNRAAIPEEAPPDEREANEDLALPAAEAERDSETRGLAPAVLGPMAARDPEVPRLEHDVLVSVTVRGETVRSDESTRLRKHSSILPWLAVFAGACATSPTGREQLMLFSSQEMSRIGEQSFEQMKKEQPKVESVAMQRYVDCIATRVLAAANTDVPANQWDVVVFDDPQVNAFALPGGNVGVYRGMVEFAETPDQLAAVIAHEIGHVIADHGNERLSQNVAAQSGLAIANAVIGGDSTKSQLILAALGVGANVGVLLPFSRDQESEADLVGLRLMAKAGFNPGAAVDLWQKMAAKQGEGPPQFLSTHPSPSGRARTLSQHVAEARRTMPNRSPQQCRPPEGVASR